MALESAFKKFQGRFPDKFTEKFTEQIKQQTGINLSQENLSQEFQKLQMKIEATVQNKFGVNLNEKIKPAINESAEKAAQLAQTAAQTAQMAAGVAKYGIDQVLLSLEHKGINVRDSQDMIQKVGLKVLERAEAIRSQVADNPLSPAWLKDISFQFHAQTKRQAAEKVETNSELSAEAKAEMSADSNIEHAENATAAASMTETTVSSVAEGMQPPEGDAAKAFNSEAAPKKKKSAKRTADVE